MPEAPAANSGTYLEPEKMPDQQCKSEALGSEVFSTNDIDVSDDEIQFIEEVPASINSACVVVKSDIKLEDMDSSPSQLQQTSKCIRRVEVEGAICNAGNSELMDCVGLSSDDELPTLPMSNKFQSSRFFSKTDECHSPNLSLHSQISERANFFAEEPVSEKVHCIEDCEMTSSQLNATITLDHKHFEDQISHQNTGTELSLTEKPNTIDKTQLNVNNIPSSDDRLSQDASHKYLLMHDEQHSIKNEIEVSNLSSSDSSKSIALHLSGANSPCNSLHTADVEYLDLSNSSLPEETEHANHDANKVIQKAELSSDVVSSIMVLHSDKVRDQSDQETCDPPTFDKVIAKPEKTNFPSVDKLETTICQFASTQTGNGAELRSQANIQNEVKPLIDSNLIEKAQVPSNSETGLAHPNINLDPSFRNFIANLPSIKKCANILKLHGNGFPLKPYFAVSSQVPATNSSTVSAESAVPTVSALSPTPTLFDTSHPPTNARMLVASELSITAQSCTTNNVTTSSVTVMSNVTPTSIPLPMGNCQSSCSLISSVSHLTLPETPFTPSTACSSSPASDSSSSIGNISQPISESLVCNRSSIGNAAKSVDLITSKNLFACNRDIPDDHSFMALPGSRTSATDSESGSSRYLKNSPEQYAGSSSIAKLCDPQPLKGESEESGHKTDSMTSISQSSFPVRSKLTRQPCLKPSFAVRELRSLLKTSAKSLTARDGSKDSCYVPLPENYSALETAVLNYSRRPPLQPLKRNDMFRGVVLLGDERYDCLKKAWEQPLSNHPLQVIARHGLTLSGTLAVLRGFILEHLMTACSSISKVIQQLMIVCTIGWRDLIEVTAVENGRKQVRLVYPQQFFVSSVVNEMVSASTHLRSLLSSSLKGVVVFAHIWPVNIVQYEEFINRKSRFILNKEEQDDLQEMSDFLMDSICQINREMSNRHLSVHSSLPYDLKRKAVTHWNLSFKNTSLINGIIPFTDQVDLIYKRLQDLYSMYVYKIENICKFGTLFIIGDTRLASLLRVWSAKSRLAPVFILSDDISPDNILEIVGLHCVSGDAVIFAPSVRHLLLGTKVFEDEQNRDMFKYPSFSENSYNADKTVSKLLKAVQKQRLHPILSQVTMILSFLAPFDLQNEVRTLLTKYNIRHSPLRSDVTLNAGLEEDNLILAIDNTNGRLVEACVVANVPVLDLFARGSWNKGSAQGVLWEGRSCKNIFDTLHMYKLSSDVWNEYEGPKDSSSLSIKVTVINLADQLRQIVLPYKLSSKVVVPLIKSHIPEDASFVGADEFNDSLHSSERQRTKSSRKRRRSLSSPISLKDRSNKDSSKHKSSRYLDNRNDSHSNSSRPHGQASSGRLNEDDYDDEYSNVRELCGEDERTYLSPSRRGSRGGDRRSDSRSHHHRSSSSRHTSAGPDHSQKCSSLETSRASDKSASRTSDAKMDASSSISTKKSRCRARSRSSSHEECSRTSSRNSSKRSKTKKKRKKKSSENKNENGRQKNGISETYMSELINLSLNQLKRIHASEWEHFRRWPHTHPSYTKELAQFFSLEENAKRYSQGLADGDIRAEWQEFWIKRMNKIEKEEFTAKIKHFEMKTVSDLRGLMDTMTGNERNRPSPSSSSSESEDDRSIKGRASKPIETKHKSRKQTKKYTKEVNCDADSDDERTILSRVKKHLKKALKVSGTNSSIPNLETLQLCKESTSGEIANASSSTASNISPPEDVRSPSPPSPPAFFSSFPTSTASTVEPSAVLKFAIHLTPKIGLLASALPLMLTKVLDAEASCRNPLDAVAGDDLTLLCLVHKQLEAVANECAPVDGIVVLECLKHLGALIASVRQNIEVDIRKTAIETMGMDNGNIIIFLVKHLRELNSKQDIMSVYKKVVHEHKRMKKYMADNPNFFKFSM